MNNRILLKAGALFLAACTCFGASAAPLSLSKYPGQKALNELKVMNYYPSAHSWKKMWTQWDPATIDKDFALIASMHANTVRVIVNVEAFGFSEVSDAMLGELRQTIDMATSHGLQVQLTLFDWWSTYTDIPDSKKWVDAVVGPYRNDPRIAFIELKNEIDPGNAAAMAWAREMIPYLQGEVGDIPVTLSVTNGASTGPAQQLSNLVTALGDVKPGFLDIHQYYGSPVEDYYQLSQAKQTAEQQGAALFVGETGASTSKVDFSSIAIPQTRESYEAWQDYVYRSAFLATSKLGLPAAAPWTLFDFVPKSLKGTGAAADEYDFGLYRVDGKAKMAAATVSNFFAHGTVDTSFNNGFEHYIKGSPDLPTLWQINEPNLAHFAIDTTQSHSGHASVMISGASSGSNGNPSFYITPIANIAEYSDHTASVYVKGLNATGTTQICLSWFNSSFGYLGNQCGGSLSGKKTEWKQISVEGQAPKGTAFVQLFLSSYDNTGTAWFDDVEFH